MCRIQNAQHSTIKYLYYIPIPRIPLKCPANGYVQLRLNWTTSPSAPSPTLTLPSSWLSLLYRHCQLDLPGMHWKYDHLKSIWSDLQIPCPWDEEQVTRMPNSLTDSLTANKYLNNLNIPWVLESEIRLGTHCEFSWAMKTCWLVKARLAMYVRPLYGTRTLCAGPDMYWADANSAKSSSNTVTSDLEHPVRRMVRRV